MLFTVLGLLGRARQVWSRPDTVILWCRRPPPDGKWQCWSTDSDCYSATEKEQGGCWKCNDVPNDELSGKVFAPSWKMGCTDKFKSSQEVREAKVRGQEGTNDNSSF